MHKFADTNPSLFPSGGFLEYQVARCKIKSARHVLIWSIVKLKNNFLHLNGNLNSMNVNIRYNIEHILGMF